MQTARIRSFLQQHRFGIQSSVEGSGDLRPRLLRESGNPDPRNLFSKRRKNLTRRVIQLVSPRHDYEAMRSLASELHVMLQHYIRAKVILGGLSFIYCSVGMLVFGFSRMP